jgi:rubrerythrin
MSPQTEKNLERAMAIEAFGHAKYARFAATARMSKNPDLASLFQSTADLDRTAHFSKGV